MLIIFDLDDTLVDTSGCITYYKWEDALKGMIAAGLSIPVYADALELLRRLDRAALSARQALSEFIEILGASSELVQIGKQEMDGPIPEDLPIFPLEGALDLLASLSLQHQLALVTVGRTPRQLEKLKKAGIDSQVFSKIVATEDLSKKPHYQTIVEELGYFPADVLVCGDRVPVDLEPARELGFKTVQMQWGRGLSAAGRQGDVDYRIAHLLELKAIVDHLAAFSTF